MCPEELTDDTQQPERQPKNNLYTRGYLLKRLRDRNIQAIPLMEYSNEVRKWTLLLWPSTHKMLLTCYKTNPEDFWFKLVFKMVDMKIRTKSAEVLISQINSLLEE